MALDLKLLKAREKAKADQTIIVARWPRKPVMTMKEAVSLAGEDNGPQLHRLANAGKRKPSRRPDLEKLVLDWGKSVGRDIVVIQLPPEPNEQTWQKAKRWAAEAEARGDVAILIANT